MRDSFKPSLSTTLVLATFTQLPLSMRRGHSLSLIWHLEWKMFCLWKGSSSLETCLSWCLIINNPRSRGLILSLEEVWEEVLLGEGGEKCSLSTSFLKFKAMVLLVWQFEAMCPYPKHLKHLMELDLWEVEWWMWSLGDLLLLSGSWWELEGNLSCFF